MLLETPLIPFLPPTGSITFGFLLRENLFVLNVGALCWKPQEQGVMTTAASLRSAETEVIEPEGGRKRHTGVASNAETCTTQTQDFAPPNQ